MTIYTAYTQGKKGILLGKDAFDPLFHASRAGLAFRFNERSNAYIFMKNARFLSN